MKPLQIVILSKTGVATASLLGRYLTNAKIYAPEKLLEKNFIPYKHFSELIKQLYKENFPIIALCASGILVRILAPLLSDKFEEPPVLTLAPDGTICVPLLGANRGANDIARKIAKITQGVAAVTTSGELQFGVNLLNPPDDLELINREDAKPFIAKLLNGSAVEIHGHHPWLAQSTLPLSNNAPLQIYIKNAPICDADLGSSDRLIYHVKINKDTKNKSKRGRLSIIGIGPGDETHLTLAAQAKLAEADEIYGYHYYIELVKPWLNRQRIYSTDNRQELDRAQTALDSAEKGHNVALISSGDPGVFAMATAVLEILEKEPHQWSNVELDIEPGITAAFAAAARIGAPLGHDFAVISLSNNLKPWSIIEERLIAGLKSDLVLALYNPVSVARPDKIKKCINILRQHCSGDRVIIIGTDIFRKNETVTFCKLQNLDSKAISSRSILIVGSSKTKSFVFGNQTLAYTPRHYP